MTTPSKRTWWERRARLLVMRVNTGWWLDLFLPAMLGLSVICASALLVLRRLDHPLLPYLFPCCLLGLGGIGLACLLAARRRFYSVRDGLVRLEVAQGLYSRLSAAAEGVGEWPAAVTRAGDGLSWRWRRCLVHPLAALALLAAALLVPIRPDAAEAARRFEEPLAWAEMEAWVDTLEEESLVEQERLQELREQVGQLRAQPTKEWYRHSSLEATDTLKQQTEQAVRELARDLQVAHAGLQALAPFEEALPVSMNEAWKSVMKEALDGLALGDLPLDRELLKKLQGIDPSNLRALTQEELEKLKEALAKGCRACSACTGGGTNDVAVLVACLQGWGRGGVDRGPGEAPLFLKEKETRLGTTALEAMQSPNYNRAALGDTLAVGQTEHHVDESLFQGPQAGGAADAQGEGGETVWRTTLPPEEQAVLQRYFQ